jgi:hypothetical protein
MPKDLFCSCTQKGLINTQNGTRGDMNLQLFTNSYQGFMNRKGL